MSVELDANAAIATAPVRPVPSRPGPAAPRRREVSLKVREARERLTSGSGLTPDVQADLLRQFARQRLGAVLPLLVMVLGVAGAALVWTDAGSVALWLMTALPAQAATLALARRFLHASPGSGPPEGDAKPADEQAERTPAKEGSLQVWRRRFALAEALTATCWAMVGLHLAAVPLPTAHIFVLFLMLLVVAMSIMLSASVPLLMYIGAVPISAAVLVMAMLDRSLTTSAVGVMAGGALVYFMLLGGRLHRSAIESLSFRLEKDALIAELEQAKANSDEARRRAEEANLAKSRFLATMSHELRTPLNAILGFSEVMKSEVFGPLTVPNYREYVADIHSSGQHLLELINEILDLSRIEAGRYELAEEQVNLAYMAEDCRHLLQLRAKAKAITVREAFETGMPTLWADERAVRQITLNLLSNAIKFTPQGGEITLKVGWTASGGQYLAVTDNGAGIPEEEMATVLSSFGRGSFAIKTAEQGSGLGLPIVKGLVDLHGGRFTLTSKPRQGTEAVVIFPAERVMEPLAPVAPGEQAGRSSGSRAA